MVEIGGTQAGEVEVKEHLPKPSSPPLDCPGPFERIAAALKVAALAIGPMAAVGGVFSFIQLDSTYAQGTVGAALLWGTLAASSGVVVRWLTLGASSLAYRAATALIFAAGLGWSADFARRALERMAEQYSGPAATVVCIGFLGLYWSIASTFLARDGEATRGRRQWRMSDLAISLLIFGVYAAALRWLILWLEAHGEDAATMLFGTAFFAGIFLIPFVVDLACRFAARSRHRWAFAGISLVLSLGIGSWSLVELFSPRNAGSLFLALVFMTALYLPLSATLAGLMEWRPLLPTLRRLDERFWSRRTEGGAISTRDVSLVSSSAEN